MYIIQHIIYNVVYYPTITIHFGHMRKLHHGTAGTLILSGIFQLSGEFGLEPR